MKGRILFSRRIGVEAFLHTSFKYSSMLNDGNDGLRYVPEVDLAILLV